ncbi:16S rRNA (guanine(527)-N(7))-methyltransferase RsmG [candidate division WOR-3 bacterium]|nr:16S rRNA (guanine(527)-N(7))-methyltransferase RsmG [candidate division WOR-3 bacterium]
MNLKLERFLLEHGIELSVEQKALLDRYRAIFLEVSEKINLISAADRNLLEEVHFADSFAPIDLIPNGIKLADWGSGGGLPGIPLAIARPDIHVTLVESRQKKASFLLRVINELKIPNLSLFPDRAEKLTVHFDFITIRAIGKIKEVLPKALVHLSEEGGVLFYKGPGLPAEFDEARRLIDWHGLMKKERKLILPLGEERRYLLLFR